MPQTLKLHTSSSCCEIIPNRGGLISSLQVNGREILYCSPDFSSEETSWPHCGIPLCFPFAGRVWSEGELYQYKLGQSKYTMPLHGFAYAISWNAEKKSEHQAVLKLAATESTRELYPFDFLIELTVTLTPRGLRIESCIQHTKSLHPRQKMPVAMGWHPYLKTSAQSAWTFDIPAKEFYPVSPIGAAGKLSSVEEITQLKPWSIEHPLFKSLIFSNLESPRAILRSSHSSPECDLSWGPKDVFNHVVLWTQNPSDFYCVEPWMSLPDAIEIPSGCMWLHPGERVNAWFELNT